MTIISLLYASVAVISILAYIPQIIRLTKRQTDCRDLSLTSWWIWNYTAAASLLYAIFEVGDLLFIISCATNILGVNIIIFLTLYKRWKFKQRAAA